MTTEQTADAAFGLLSNEIRVDVLRAVATAQNEAEQSGGGIAELPFSEIYERVDVDSTSKLSYHLTELTGTFLRKGDEGYSFTHAGERMARFVLAKNYDRPAEFGPLETDGTCLFCGESALEATLHDQYFVVRCSACGRPATGYTVTPAQTRAHDGAELLEALKRKQAIEYELVQRNVCPECGGSVTTEVRAASETTLPDEVPISFVTIDECQHCLRIYSGPMTYSVAYHPASVAFHWDRGVDIMQTGMWEFHDHVRDGRWTAERIETDPPEYRVVFRRSAAALTVHLDDTARVTRTERVRSRTLD